MPNLSWSHTHTVRNGKGKVFRGCSFKTAPFTEGQRCSVYKGKLLDSLQNTDAVVKAYHPLNRETVADEMKKHNFSKKVLSQCSQTTVAGVDLVHTWESTVDKVGKGGKLWREVTKAGGYHVTEGDCVVVQDLVQGLIQQLFSLEWTETLPAHQASNMAGSQCLLDLMRKSYRLSAGNCVIGAAKGVLVHDSQGRGLTFRLTSLTIHSRKQEFGAKDLGIAGVEMYERWDGVSPRIPPSAPALDVWTNAEESCQPGRSSNMFNRATSWSQQPVPGEEHPPAYCTSWPQQPVPREEPPPAYCPGPCGNQTLFSVPPHAADGSDVVDGGSGGRRRTLADVLAATPELRAFCTEQLLDRILGPAPPYSDCMVS